LAGFLLEKLQHVPNSGETLLFKEVKFEICSMKGPRIDLVKLILIRKPQEGNQ